MINTLLMTITLRECSTRSLVMNSSYACYDSRYACYELSL